MERLFWIVDDVQQRPQIERIANSLPNKPISETELKQRLDFIRRIEMIDYDGLINVLLHGTEKDQPEQYDPLAYMANPTWKAMTPDEIERITNPSKPTRKEWEEWVKHLPHWADKNINTWDQWQVAFKQWLLTMPGVPKP